MREQPNKQVKKYRGSNSYTAPFARFEYQIDIMDMVSLVKNPEAKIPIEKGALRYALVVIDIFSKLANVVPMANRDSSSVLSALKESFKKMGFPMSVYSDDDGAFKSVVKEFFWCRRYKSNNNLDSCKRSRKIYKDNQKYDTWQSQIQ